MKLKWRNHVNQQPPPRGIPHHLLRMNQAKKTLAQRLQASPQDRRICHLPAILSLSQQSPPSSKTNPTTTSPRRTTTSRHRSRRGWRPSEWEAVVTPRRTRTALSAGDGRQRPRPTRSANVRAARPARAGSPQDTTGLHGRRREIMVRRLPRGRHRPLPRLRRRRLLCPLLERDA